MTTKKKTKGRTAAHHRAGYGLNGLMLPHEQAYLVQRPLNTVNKLIDDLRTNGEFVPYDFAQIAAFVETVFILTQRKEHPLFFTMRDWLRPWLCSLWDEDEPLNLSDLDKFKAVIQEAATVARTTSHSHYTDAMSTVRLRMAARKADHGLPEPLSKDEVCAILGDLPSLLGPGVQE